MTPYIFEKTPQVGQLIDIYSRLLMDRIIFLEGPVNDEVASILKSQILWLNHKNKENKDITMYINSPGGSMTAGFSIIDVMELSKADISTINIGECCSMASLILASGTRGKRKSLKRSKIMLHQSSSYIGGNIQDANINIERWKGLNEELFNILHKTTNQPITKLKKDTKRDKWFNAEEAIKYNLIDHIITEIK